MLAAIPLETESELSLISARFARSPFFALVSREPFTIDIIENPCADIKTMTGICVAGKLTEKYAVDTFIAFELGWKICQFSQNKDIQLIILDNKNKTLKDLLKYITQK
jgi:predicted Fe-Mo cluster-binding NifX family protein